MHIQVAQPFDKYYPRNIIQFPNTAFWIFLFRLTTYIQKCVYIELRNTLFRANYMYVNICSSTKLAIILFASETFCWYLRVANYIIYICWTPLRWNGHIWLRNCTCYSVALITTCTTEKVKLLILVCPNQLIATTYLGSLAFIKTHKTRAERRNTFNTRAHGQWC